MEEKLYEVLVTEYLQRRVVVRARNEREARLMVESDYDQAALVLTPEDSTGAAYEVLGEVDSEAPAAHWKDYK